MIKFGVFICATFFHSLSFGFVEFPKNCIKAAEGPCHFGTVKKQSFLEILNLKIYLANNTLLKREKVTIEWVYGTVLFEIESKSAVQVKGHTISMEKGAYLFFGEEGKLKVDVLEGNFHLGRFEVTEGFQASFTVSDTIELEPLQAINLKDHLVRYVKAKNLNKAQAVDYLDEFKPKHENYISWAIDLNQNLFDRSVSSDDLAEKKRKQNVEKARLAREKQKQAYFAKVFER